MPEIEANGTRLTYTDQGQGDLLVLVHGSLGDYRTWTPQVPVLSQHYRVIAYSRRYHYPQAWTGEGPGWSAALHADDLAALVRGLGHERAHLVGSSYGALTSLYCAVRHPEVARTLVLGEPPILPWLKTAPGGRELYDAFMTGAWEPATRACQRGDLQGGVRDFVNGVSGAPVFDGIPEPVRDRQLANASALQAETEAHPTDYFSPLTCQDVGKVAVPTLLVRGEKSPRMFGLVLDELARCLPNCERASIPRASHSMASGNPAAYNEAVLAFLRRAGANGG